MGLSFFFLKDTNYKDQRSNYKVQAQRSKITSQAKTYWTFSMTKDHPRPQRSKVTDQAKTYWTIFNDQRSPPNLTAQRMPRHITSAHRRTLAYTSLCSNGVRVTLLRWRTRHFTPGPDHPRIRHPGTVPNPISVPTHPHPMPKHVAPYS